MNVDSATNVEAKTAGLGAVIRDDKGRVAAAAVKLSRLSWDVQFAEAEAGASSGQRSSIDINYH